MTRGIRIHPVVKFIEITLTIKLLFAVLIVSSGVRQQLAAVRKLSAGNERLCVSQGSAWCVFKVDYGTFYRAHEFLACSIDKHRVSAIWI